MYFIKLNRFIGLIFFTTVISLISCKKVIYENKGADFSYAENYVGDYDARQIMHSINSQYNDTTFSIMHVTNISTSTECKLYIDLINDSVYLYPDGTFVTFWGMESTGNPTTHVYIHGEFGSGTFNLNKSVADKINPLHAVISIVASKI